MQTSARATASAPKAPVPGTPTLDLARLVVDAALQPIAEIHSGDVFGFEALMRGHDRLGFDTPPDLLDHMARAGSLPSFERLVRQRALASFKPLAAEAPRSIFLNLDGRLVTDAGPAVDDLLADLDLCGIPPNLVVIELSERSDYTASPLFRQMLARLRQHGIRVALDDFGTGYSELRLLCDGGIDYVKIDRHFVSGLGQSSRKRLFVATLADLAHVLGVRVVAEGVETEEEYLGCVEAGCDLVQGYFVARPSIRSEELAPTYPGLAEARGRLRRATRSDEFLVRAEMQVLPTIRFGCGLETVFDLFARNPDHSFFPVVDDADVPVGIVHERGLKSLIYSDFGRELARNRGFRPNFERFVTQVPIADVGLSAERLLDVFAATGGSDALILTENMRYCGVFSSSSLLKVMGEKRIRTAQDLNPLSELPGNNAINDFVERATGHGGRRRTLCYFDFDHFKAFNDTYGFGRGDKAILLFARLLRERLAFGERFLGHVGGDDFFAGIYDEPQDVLQPVIMRLQADFAAEVAKLYAPEHREARSIPGIDRQGRTVAFPLMRCSVAVVELDGSWIGPGPDGIGRELATLKKHAKKSDSGLVWSRLDPGGIFG